MPEFKKIFEFIKLFLTILNKRILFQNLSKCDDIRKFISWNFGYFRNFFLSEVSALSATFHEFFERKNIS